MRYIAHRGLTEGPNAGLENQPEQISKSLAEEFDCEIDLWVVNSDFYLGHDNPDYPVHKEFLNQPGLWIHCKNLEALEFCQRNVNLNYFWHQTDDYTLTSKGYIWAYPGKKLSEFSIMVMPESVDPTLSNTRNVSCYAICSDYVQMISLDLQP
jgi:hypothetical protein